MSEARETLLARIRAAVDDGRLPDQRRALREAEWTALPRDFRRRGNLRGEELVSLFEQRLAHYQATAIRTSGAHIAEAIGEALSKRQKRRIVVPLGFPDAWLPSGFDFVRDTGLDYRALEHCDGVLTGSTVAIALSGTVVLQSDETEGRRVTSLLPDYHLCVVQQANIVEVLPEALPRLAARRTAATTYISGSSATVDIEMKRVRGVHGPRTLDVLIAMSEPG